MKPKVYIKNRKASYDFFFIRDLVAGIQLYGTEVKSIRNGKVSLVDSYCYFDSNELYVKGMNIAPMTEAFSHEPLRNRKLLLKRKELNKLQKELEKGMTIIVKNIFTNERDFIKVEIALARGKKNYDKRESIKEREIERDLKRY